MQMSSSPVSPMVLQREVCIDFLWCYPIGNTYVDLSVHPIDTYTRCKVEAAPLLETDQMPCDNNTQNLPNRMQVSSISLVIGSLDSGVVILY